MTPELEFTEFGEVPLNTFFLARFRSSVSCLPEFVFYVKWKDSEEKHTNGLFGPGMHSSEIIRFVPSVPIVDFATGEKELKEK